MRYGLIGEKLGHSYSKIIHEKLADYTYDLIPLSKEEFKVFMQKKDFTAINVTIPYKQAVIPYLDEMHPLAKRIGAVNTIVNKSGRFIGYNTDFYGIEYMLRNNKIQIKDKKCAILGNGGTSQTAFAALEHLGASDIQVISRKPSDTSISYEDFYKTHTDTEIIINTTPLGMYPNIDASPLDLTTFIECEAVVDVIFNPLQTKLTLQAIELHKKAITGLEMLVAQAKQAVEYFLDRPIPESKIQKIYMEILAMINSKVE
ncbi:shikimate dehydrogenase [Mobilitalea sibirica]|uniref:Shikimate dehydrogenase n=1 Tax=Mobilitalea sibirica TaxID=1462919 RepID=A0A8J7KVI0_9FIRM|nr:shikimate dehydrogenase [Mobilitalea sibirica]MBH1940195.1 shikimate dehydrogenase [Mobilitalea sibirica]